MKGFKLTLSLFFLQNRLEERSKLRRGIEKNDKDEKNETPTGKDKEDDVEMVEVVNERSTSHIPSSDLLADER